MRDAGVDELLIDRELCAHDRVVGGRKDCVHAVCNQRIDGLGDLIVVGAGLLVIGDSLFVKICLRIGDRLRRGILRGGVQEADVVGIPILREDQIHDRIGVQRIGGTGDVPAGRVIGRNKACAHRIRDSREDDRGIGVLESGLGIESGGSCDADDDIDAVIFQLCHLLLQKGLIALAVEEVVGIIEGHTKGSCLCVQLGLDVLRDLVQGSVVHVLDDTDLIGGACGSGGRIRGCYTRLLCSGSCCSCRGLLCSGRGGSYRR